MKSVLRPLTVAVAAALGLSACFHAADEASQVQLSGVVSKGVVIGGVVKAYPIVNGVIDKTQLLGKDTTDAKGNYSINVVGYEGPIAVVMSPDGNSSQVKCDVPAGCTAGGISYNFGGLMPLDYEMEAIVPNAKDGAVSASVTPLTHMAAAYAKSIGLDKDTAALANEKVAKMLGIEDVLGSKPVDVTDDAALQSNTTSIDSIKYGYIAAAIAKIAQEDSSGDVGTALNALADTFSTNAGELVTRESTDSTGVVSLQEIVTAAKDIIDAETDFDTSTVGGMSSALTQIDTLKDTADTAEADSTTSTTTTTQIASSDVDTAKAVVAELRTWAQKINDELIAQVEDPSTLDASAPVTFAKKVQTAIDNDNGNIDALMQGVENAVMASSQAFSQGDGTHDLSTIIDDLMIVASGSVVVSGQSVVVNGATFAITDDAGVTRTTTVSLNVTMPPASGTSFTLTINSASASNAGATLDVVAASTATVTVDTSITGLYDEVSSTRDAAKVTKLSLKLGATLAQKETTAVTDPLSFSGNVSGVAYFTYTERQDAYYDSYNGEVVTFGTWTQTDIAPESVKLDGEFRTSSGDSLKAVAEGYMRNASTFKPVAPTALGTEKAGVATYTVSTDMNTITVEGGDSSTVTILDTAKGIITTIHYWSDGYDSYSSPVTVNDGDTLLSLANSDPYLMRGNYVWVSGEGEYYAAAAATWSASGGSLSGVLVRQDENDESATMWRDIDGKVTFTVDFADLPAATVTLSGDRTAWHAGSGTAVISYDTVTITATGSVAEVEGQDDPAINLSIVVQTTAGVLELRPDLQSGSALGTIKVGGNIVGSIKPSEGLNGEPMLIITYKNGDVESVLF